MKVIVFGTIKGGVGKSSCSIMTARCLAAAGFKVLVCDFDVNNSSSFAFTPSNIDEIDPKGCLHMAAALQQGLTGNPLEFAIKTDFANIDLIRSSLYLVDLRTIAVNRFKNIVSRIPDNTYDFIIVDTPPTYDNLVLTAFEAADVIVSPVILDQFNFNTILFERNKLVAETNVADKHKILINSYQPEYERYANSKQKDYVNLFEQYFDNILSVKLPRSSLIKSCIDRNELLGFAEKSAMLRSSIVALCSEITGLNINPTKAF